MLRNSKDMAVTWERDIQAHTLRASRLRVGVSTKCFFPPSTFVLLVIIAVRGVCLFSPVLQIHIAVFVELNMCLSISLKFHIKWRMANHCLERASWSVEHLGDAILRVCVQGRRLAQFQAPNHSPFLGLIVPLLASLTVVLKIDLALQSLFFVDHDSCGTGLEEGYGERESDFLILRCRLHNNTLQLRIFKVDGRRIELVWRAPG